MGGLVVSTLLFCWGCDSSANSPNAVAFRFFYIPIGAETLTPVTSENIEQRGHRCDIRSTKDMHTIRKVLDSATSPTSFQKFTNLTVRVKLLEISATGGKLIAVVENDGMVRFASGKERFISIEEMKSLKRVIEEQCEWGIASRDEYYGREPMLAVMIVEQSRLHSLTIARIGSIPPFCAA